jgi:hypothetical protein
MFVPPCALLPTETCFLPSPASPYLPRLAPYRSDDVFYLFLQKQKIALRHIPLWAFFPTETCFPGWLPSPVMCCQPKPLMLEMRP